MKFTKKDILIFILAIAGAISLQLAFFEFGIRDENIYLMFVVAILVLIIETKKISLGIMGTFILVMSFNFFITEPRYTFVISDHNYYFSFIIFILVALVVNSLVTQLYRQIDKANNSQRKIEALYHISASYLEYRNSKKVYQKTLEILKSIYNNPMFIYCSEDEIYGNNNFIDLQKNELNSALKGNKPFSKDIFSFFPIKTNLKDYGVLVIQRMFNEEETEFINNIVESLCLVLDKEYISNQQQQSNLQIEKEKFKNSILRALSHDIKTPLTMIQSGSEFINDSYDILDDENRKTVINDIYNESVNLYSFVNNLLDMSLMSDDKKMLDCKMELLDDIYSDVVHHTENMLRGKKLNILHSEEMISIWCNGRLISHVFINLIENAVKHTRANSTIYIHHQLIGNRIIFNVSDNGGGIDPKIIDHIFDDFYSLTTKEDRHRSHGLGLSICKAIVEAHGGTISAYNNMNGGATFEFVLPLEGEENG